MKKRNLILMALLIFPFLITAEEISVEVSQEAPEEILDEIANDEELTAEEIADYSDYDQLVRALLEIEEEMGLSIILTRNVSMIDTVDSISKSLRKDLGRLSTELVIQEKEALESLDETKEDEATKSKVMDESRNKFNDIESKISRIEKMLTDLERRKKYLFNPQQTTKPSVQPRKTKPGARRRSRKVFNSPMFVYEEDIAMPSRNKPKKLISEPTVSPLEAKRAARKKKKNKKPPQVVAPAKTRTRKR